MIIDSVLSMKTNAGLLDAIKRAASLHMTPKDIIEQRISFVYGSMDTKNGITREQIRKVVLNQAGETITIAG